MNVVLIFGIIVLAAVIFAIVLALINMLGASGAVRRAQNVDNLREAVIVAEELDDNASKKSKRKKASQGKLDAAGIKMDSGTWNTLVFGGAIIAGAVGSVLVSPYVGVALVLIVLIAPQVIINIRVKKRNSKFDEQLARALPIVAENLRTGLSFERSLISVSENTADPLRTEFKMVASMILMNGDTVGALQNMAERTGSSDIQMLKAAVQCSKESGGSLANSLEKIAQKVDTRLQIRRDIETETASTKSSVKILLVIPFIILLVICSSMDHAREFYFGSIEGIIVLVVVACMCIFGALLIYKMADIKLD